MSPSLILHILGLGLVLVGQRLFDGPTTTAKALTAVGLLAALGALVLRNQAKGKASESGAAAEGRALLLQVLSASSVLVWFLSTDTVVDAVGLSEEGADRWSVSFQALWPVIWACSTFPLVLVDLAIQDSPLAVQPLRIRQATDNGLIAALGLCLVFPMNYLAHAHNERWDFAYFKTTAPGTSTVAIVENLTEPVVVRVFTSTSSDVAPELRPYFEALAKANPDQFKVEWLDHAAEPTLAKELKVRENGTIAVTSKDGTDDAVTKTWKVGDSLDDAKRNLKKLDEEFQNRLLELAKGERIAYFTVGHGELSWKGGELETDKIVQFKSLLSDMNFKVKELGLAEGLGDEVPADAAVVYVWGPTEPFLDGEMDALKAYIDRGGSVFVAVDLDRQGLSQVGAVTEGQSVEALLNHVGLKSGTARLATDGVRLELNRDKTDALNLVTNKYSSHESTTTLSKYAKQAPMVLMGSTWLEENPGHKGKVTFVIKTIEDAWADLDGELDFDAETEKREVRNVAAVATGPSSAEDGREYRVIAVGDASIFSDFVITRSKTSLQYAYDAANWLTREEALSGTVENEEDIKIEHTNEEQKLWFYSTTLGIPLVVVLLGALRVRSRARRGGEA